MQITINVKDGATNKDIAAQLRWQAGLIEGMDPKEAAARKNTDGAKAAAAAANEEADETEETDTDDDFTEAPAKTAKSKKGTKKAAASFDDDEDAAGEEAEESTDETEEDDFTEAPPKKAKGKKLTVDDVNDACKARAAKSSRKDVLALLKKHFKTQSVSELKPEQYAKAIEVMKA